MIPPIPVIPVCHVPEHAQQANNILTAIDRFCIKKPLKASLIIPLMGAIACASLKACKRPDLSERLKTSLQAISALNLLGSIYLIHVMFQQWQHIPSYLFLNHPIAKINKQLVQFGMQNSTFYPANCIKDEVVVGSVKITREKNLHDVPVLKINAQDPFLMGYVQGYLLGNKIEEVYHRVFKPMALLVQLLTRDYSGKKLKERIKQITYPEQTLKEMQGILAGLKAYAKQHNYHSDVTLDHFKAVHALADTYKKIGLCKVFGRYASTMGCSAAIIKSQSAMVLARTLDWPGMQDLAKYCMLKEYQVNGRSIRVQSFPGYCGVLTGSNSDGLRVVINELGDYVGDGVPYAILARMVIENAANIKEAMKIVRSKAYNPASSHHLIMMDKKKGCDVQYINKDNVLVRYLKEDGALIVTNHALDENGNPIAGTETDITSFRRFNKMAAVIQQGFASNEEINEIARKAIKCVDMFNTTCAVIYREFDARTESHAFDAHYAASHL